VTTQGCSLVRNVILARYLTKADFGVAAALAMIITLFEMASKMALGQQVIQSPRGDDPAFLNSVQFTQLALGIISAALILVFAWPLSHFFCGGHYTLAIVALSLVPFMNGLVNLDVYRASRHLDFRPQVVPEAVSQITTTLAAWPLAFCFGDYRAVLCIFIGKALMSAAMTNYMAERPFAPKYDRPLLRESLKFGGPLLVAGFVQFGNFQGDSMVIAATYSLPQLGEYSVGLTLAMAPLLAVMRIGGAVGLPLLSAVQTDLRRFLWRYSQYAQSMVLIGCFAMLCMTFCGEQIVVFLYPKYAGVGTLATCLMAAQTLRTLRGATVAAAMARGDTVNNLKSSAWRLSGLPLAIMVGVLKGSLLWFAVSGFIGESIALGVAVAGLKSRHGIPAKATFIPLSVGLALVVVAYIVKCVVGAGPYSYFNLLLLAVSLGAAGLIFTVFFAEFRAGVLSLVNHFRVKPPSALAAKSVS